MNKLLIRILIFLIPIFLVSFGMEIFLRFAGNSYLLKSQQLIKNLNKIEVLFLGNSHAAYGINPTVFDLNSFNLAQVNQSIYFDKRITKKSLDQLNKLKYVFISVDYHSFYFSSQGIRNQWSYYSNKVRYKHENDYLAQNSYLIGFTPKLAFTSCYEYFNKKKYNNKYFALDMQPGGNVNKAIEKGWFSFEGTNQDAMNYDSFSIRVKGFNSLILSSTEKKEIFSDLDNFIKILKNKNITPILFTSPCYSEYNQLLDKKILNQNKKDIEFLTNKYKIEYWNYLELSLHQSDYYNCDHLNIFGATKFSKILNERLNKLSNKN